MYIPPILMDRTLGSALGSIGLSPLYSSPQNHHAPDQHPSKAAGSPAAVTAVGNPASVTAVYYLAATAVYSPASPAAYSLVAPAACSPVSLASDTPAAAASARVGWACFVRYSHTVRIRWGCFDAAAVWKGSRWGNAAQPGTPVPCATAAGSARAGSAGTHSSGSPVPQDLYVTDSTSRHRSLSLRSVRRVRPTVHILTNNTPTFVSTAGYGRFCDCLLFSNLSEFLIFSKSLDG